MARFCLIAATVMALFCLLHTSFGHTELSGFSGVMALQWLTLHRIERLKATEGGER